MSFLSKINEVIAERNKSLEDILIEMSKYGRVRLGQYGSNGLWSCSVEMYVPTVGVTFEVKSDYNLNSPMAAVIQCRERIIQTISQKR